MDSQTTAVIGDTVLREVVDANPLAAVSGTDQCTPSTGAFGVGGGLLSFEDAAFQDSQCLRAILVLAFFVLTFHNDSSWQVSQSHGTFRLIHFLTTGTTSTHRIDLEIFGTDVNFYFVRFGQNGDRRCAGMHASLSFGRWHSLNTMTEPGTIRGARLSSTVLQEL